MKSLLKEFTGTPTPTPKIDLKNSDKTDAGKNDVANKIKSNDITFSLMRNTINSNGEVTGSDVANYLERAADLNDEVDTVPFGLEDSDGDIVKVYVNAEQADKFAEELKKLLGIEDDIEEVINKLAQDFDIIDVVWPKDKTDDNSDELKLGAENEFDALDDDEFDVMAEFDNLDESLKTNEDEDAFKLYNQLSAAVAQLEAMSSAGVEVVTGGDRKTFTKTENIKRYISERYSQKCELIRSWLKRSPDSLEEDLPYWL